MPIAQFRFRSAARVVLALAAVALGLACVPARQFRTVTVQEEAAGSWQADTVCEIPLEGGGPRDCALEHRRYMPPGGESPGEALDYYFATVEFDDEGWFWDRRQMEVVLRFLFERHEEEFLIFAHAHGWQHNADACDNNVVCLQRFLERMDLTERALTERLADPSEKPRKILGIYISWRGRSVKVPKVAATTFWSRKRAGQRVGVGGVTELLTRLNDFRQLRNPQRQDTKTQLVISGHSFGGLVIYKALAHSLIERAIDMWPTEPGDEQSYAYEVASSFGDLVVLVNPAFEGSTYESLQHAATHRCFPARQRPVMLVVTSSADSATGRAFPLGRTLSTMFTGYRSPDQRRAVRHTVGHLDRYRTHDLKLEASGGGDTPTAAGKSDDGPCGCPYLPPTDQFTLETEDADYLRQLAEVRSAREDADGDDVYEPGARYASVAEFDRSEYGLDRQGNLMYLEREPDYAANYPYLVIRTDDYFIPSHSAIYGERFVDFLRRFFVRHIAARVNFPVQCFEAEASCRETPITPCERSWLGRSE